MAAYLNDSKDLLPRVPLHDPNTPPGDLDLLTLMADYLAIPIPIHEDGGESPALPLSTFPMC